MTSGVDTPLSPRAREIAKAYWSWHMGYPLRDLGHGQVRVVGQSTELAGYRGIFVLSAGGGAVIAAPPDAPLEPLSRLTFGQALDAAALSPILAPRVERFVGPAFIGYADEDSLRSSGTARLLRAGDTKAVDALRLACPAEDWAHGGGSLGERPAVGAWEGERLAALATFDVWKGVIGHISIVADPSLRGRGHARAAVALLARLLLREGLLPQYRTLVANEPSMKLAAALGFAEFARSLAVRFK